MVVIVVVVVEVVVVMMVVVTVEEAWSSNMFIQTVMFTRSSNPLGAPLSRSFLRVKGIFLPQ